MMKDRTENLALKWAAIIRESSEYVLNTVFTEMDKESILFIKLQILLREYLIANSEEAVLTAEEVSPEVAEEIRKEMQPLLIEELFSTLMPYEVQGELAEYLYRCLEGEKTFFALFSEALSGVVPDVKQQETAEALIEKAMEQIKNEVLSLQEEKQETERQISGFPVDYPYMDEFEYIDHCIAGDYEEDRIIARQKRTEEDSYVFHQEHL